MTMASSVLLQMNPWHSSTLGELAERMTTAKMGAWIWMLCSTASCSLELLAVEILMTFRRWSCRGPNMTHLRGWNREVLSIFSGSVIRGRKAAPPSSSDMTNFTADHTAMLWKGVMSASFSSAPSGLAPFEMAVALTFTRKPVAQMSKEPELSFFKIMRIMI